MASNVKQIDFIADQVCELCMNVGHWWQVGPEIKDGNSQLQVRYFRALVGVGNFFFGFKAAFLV